jgi:hypothetical protein
VPDSPVNLQNDPSVTRNNVLRFTWQDGSSDGGSSILDYRITYDQSTGNYITLASGVTENSY